MSNGKKVLLDAVSANTVGNAAYSQRGYQTFQIINGGTVNYTLTIYGSFDDGINGGVLYSAAQSSAGVLLYNTGETDLNYFWAEVSSYVSGTCTVNMGD